VRNVTLLSPFAEILLWSLEKTGSISFATCKLQVWYLVTSIGCIQPTAYYYNVLKKKLSRIKLAVFLYMEYQRETRGIILLTSRCHVGLDCSQWNSSTPCSPRLEERASLKRVPAGPAGTGNRENGQWHLQGCAVAIVGPCSAP